jgi:hypothetical protein
VSHLTNQPVDRERETASAPQAPSTASPVRVFVIGAIVIVAFVAVLSGAIRAFVFPVWEANSQAAQDIAVAQARLSAAQTQEALAPPATSTPIPTPTVQPSAVPTAVTTVLPAAAAAEGAPEPSIPAGDREPAWAAKATAGLLPTPTTQQAEDVFGAYQNYFSITDQALLNLDPTVLGDVTSGDELASLQQSIEQDRAQGRALQRNVEHDVYVLDVQGDEADVADRFLDSSIYVDPATHTPLPGQIAPASPDVAPAVSVVYHLQRIDSAWKVVDGVQYVPQATQ